MNIRTQIVVCAILVISFIIITDLVRQKKLEIKYYFPWMITILLLLVFTIFPQTLAWLVSLFGIAIPLNMAFFFGIVFSLAIIFALTVAMSRNAYRIRRMAQKIAMLEQELEELKKELKE